MFKLILSGLIAIVIVALGISALSSKRQQQEFDAIERAADRGHLKWYAKRAKIKGEKQSVFRASIPYYVSPKDLDEALAYYDVVLAEAVESKSISVHPMEIETWYKFRVIDHLSHKEIIDCPTCPEPRTPLTDMLPLSADEILVPKGGGQWKLTGLSYSASILTFPRS